MISNLSVAIRIKPQVNHIAKISTINQAGSGKDPFKLNLSPVKILFLVLLYPNGTLGLFSSLKMDDIMTNTIIAKFFTLLLISLQAAEGFSQTYPLILPMEHPPSKKNKNCNHFALKGDIDTVMSQYCEWTGKHT